MENATDLDNVRTRIDFGGFTDAPDKRSIVIQTQRTSESVAIIELAGDLRTGSLTDFKTQVATLLQDNCSDIIVDCGNLGFVSSSGLAAFLWADARAKKARRRMYFTHVTAPVLEVLNITRLSRFFQIEPSTAALVKSLDRPPNSGSPTTIQPIVG